MAERTEVVRLTLQDDFTAKMARAAAAAAALDKSLSGIDGQNVRASKSTDGLTQSVTRQGAVFQKESASINQFSGRLRLLTEVAVLGTPALVGLGAVAVPAVTGLAAAFGFAAVGAGVLVAGFQGVGAAFEAVNKAQLEPTAENLEAAQVAMEQLSPAARNMVGEIDRVTPALEDLSAASATGIAPQMARGVDELLVGLPKLRGFFEETAGAAASVLADGVGVLNADKWQPFLRFVEDQAPDAILQLGRVTGDLSFGFAELFRNMAPINNDVLDVIEKGAAGFANWATGLETSQGLRDFFAYLRETGPQVGDALGAMANAILQIAQAAAPLSGPVLGAIEGVSNAIAAIASTDAGAPLFAMAAGALALNRALKVTSAIAAAPAIGALFGTGAAAGVAGKAGLLGASGAGGPIALAVASAALLAGPTADLVNTAKGFETLGGSLEGLGSKFQQTDMPAEFLALGQATEWMEGREGWSAIGDNINGFLGTEIGKLKESTDMFAEVDRWLSDIAAQEGPEAASAAFEQLAANSNLSREAMGQLKQQLPGFTDAVGSRSVGELLNVFESLPGAIGNLNSKIQASSLAQLSKDLSRATNSAYQFKTSLDDVNDVLTRRSASRDYQAALDAANQALKENGRTLDENTPKGRANAESLDMIGASAVTLAQKMKGAEKFEFLKGARADFIETARSMGKTAAGAERLADKLGLIDRTEVRAEAFLDIKGFTKKEAEARAALLNLDRKKASPNADLNTTQFTSKQRRALNDVGVLDRQKPTPTAGMNDGPFRGTNARVMGALGVTDRFTANPAANLIDNASGPARSIQSAIAAIQSKTVTITVNRITRGIANIMPFADGGEVRGPGGPRDDAIPAALSNGEFVVNAAATSRHLALLHQINAQKFADGGFVRPQPMPAAAVPMRATAPRQSLSVGFGRAEVMVRMPDGSSQVAQMRAIVRDELAADERFDYVMAGG